MKKIISLVLIFILMFSMSVTSFASTNEARADIQIVSETVKKYNGYSLKTMTYLLDGEVAVHKIKKYDNGQINIDFGDGNYLNIDKNGMTKSNVSSMNNVKFIEDAKVSNEKTVKGLLSSLMTKSSSNSNWTYLGSGKRNLYFDKLLQGIAVTVGVTVLTSYIVSAIAAVSLIPIATEAIKGVAATIAGLMVGMEYISGESHYTYDEWEFNYDSSVHQYTAQFYYLKDKVGSPVTWVESID